MKRYGRAALSECLGDFVVYRNLVPLDPRLPARLDIEETLGLPGDVLPRKTSPQYAKVISIMLARARELEIPGIQIERIVYVGDTRLNDGTAFMNICQAGNWPGIAFIAAENDIPVHIEIEEGEAGVLFHANRWNALQEFNHFCAQQDIQINEHTAVLLDIDKTALGARGRNDHVIDQVRLEAATQTVRDLLGNDYDPEAFQDAYQRLNQAEFHHFTSDNQDYLVYICIILAGGLYDLKSLLAEVRSGQLISFDRFISQVDQHADQLPASLRTFHKDVFALMEKGDPTPLKAFRINEYKATAARMGQMDGKTSLQELLSEMIVITHEVRLAALAWREQGALIFGLSDKPDEASIPTAKLASQGYKAIHQIETEIVGV